MPLWEMSLYVLIAFLLGSCVGFERKIRVKEAGIRTHAIVTAGACLMTLVSRFGFAGAADSARIAAQIVSGIGFLGAGIIIYNRGALRGLTTAAGVWMCAGIGMCVGVGMWPLACISTGMLLIVQFLFHLPFRIFQWRKDQLLKFKFIMTDETFAAIRETFHYKRLLKCGYQKTDTGLVCNLVIGVENNDILSMQLERFMEAYPGVLSIEFVDEV